MIDTQQIVPFPEAQEYQVRLREKEQRKRSGGWAPKSPARLWEEFEAKCEPEDVQLARHVCDWVAPLVDEVFPTKNGFSQLLAVGKTRYFFFKVSTDGSVAVWFQHFASKPPFADDNVRKELLQRFKAIPGFDITEERLTGRPGMPIAVLRDDESLRIFKEAVEWSIQQVRSQAEPVPIPTGTPKP